MAQQMSIEGLHDFQKFIDTIPNGDPTRSKYLAQLGLLYMTCAGSNEATYLDDAIRAFTESVDAAKPDDPVLHRRLIDLGTALNERYSTTKRQADLEKALEVTEKAVHLMETDPHGLAIRCVVLEVYAYETENPVDSTGAIKFARNAMEIVDQFHPSRVSIIQVLCSLLGAQHRQAQSPDSLDELISLHWQLDEAMTDESAQKMEYKLNRAFYLRERFKTRSNLQDIDEAIRLTQGALQLAAQDHPQRMRCLMNCAVFLSERFQKSQSLDDLDEAILISRQITECMPHGHPDWLPQLSNLAMRLQNRYLATKSNEDYLQAAHAVQESIQYWRRAIEASETENYGDLGRLLHCYGNHHAARFLAEDSSCNLDKAIEAYRECIQLEDDTLDVHKAKEKLLSYVSKRYYLGEALSDREEMIFWAQQLAHDSQEGSTEQAKYLIDTAQSLLLGHYRNTKLADIEKSIELGRQALKSTPRDSPMRLVYQSKLGMFLGEYYSATGDTNSLDEALKLTEEAARFLSQTRGERGEVLTIYGSVLMKQYTINGTQSILDEAITVAAETIDNSTADNDFISSRLLQLAASLLQRYYLHGSASDLDQAMKACNKALSNGTTSGIARHELMSMLDILNFHQGSVSEGDRNSSMILSLSSSEVDTGQNLEPVYPLKLKLLLAMSQRFGNSFLKTGQTADLEKAFEYGRQAIDLIPQSHQVRPEALSNLAVLYGLRYSRQRSNADEIESMRLHREALDATPVGHFERPRRLALLSSHLIERVKSFGHLQDLDEAIHLIRESISETPPQHIEFVNRETTLATLLGARYNMVGRTKDLEEAISIGKRAIVGTARPDQTQGWLLDHLALRLLSLYRRTRNKAHLEDAIAHEEASIKATDESHTHYFGRLNNLLACLISKCTITGEDQDFDQAIAIARRAIEASPPDHPDRAFCLTNFGVVMLLRFDVKGSVKDLETAARIFEKAVDLTQGDDNSRSQRLNHLGKCYQDLYIRQKKTSHFEKSTRYFLEASDISSAPIRNQVQSYWGLLRSFAATKDWSQAYQAASKAIELIPHLIMRTLSHADKQNLIRQLSQLACEAAIVSLIAGQEWWRALWLLEKGRGIISASIEDMRTDISDLETKFPQLAVKFIQLKTKLENLRTTDGDPSTQANQIDSIEEMTAGNSNPQLSSGEEKEMGDSMFRLIEDIRTKPGFDDFLLPPSSEKISAAAKEGPIVVIVVSYISCVAIIVQETTTTTLHLPQLSEKEIGKRARSSDDLGTSEILEWLWDVVAQPVLEELGFVKTPADNTTWPNIWWISTGVLGRFPLHAAGYHFRSTSQTVLDRVVSSYSLSVKSLVKSRSLSRPDAANPRSALLVGMKNTPLLCSLPSVDDELDCVRKYMKLMNINVMEPRKCKSDVLSALQQSTIFHFAGHGSTDKHEPLASYLALGEAEADPLTVADLFEINLQRQKPFLAYLSACQTGRMDDDESADESVHLINAFQLAGFRHVIGTLWKVEDKYCVDMANLIYKSIQDGGMTDLSVRIGLHNASRMLRTRWVSTETERRARHHEASQRASRSCGKTSPGNQPEGIVVEQLRNITLCDDDDEDFHWARYVHFGV